MHLIYTFTLILLWRCEDILIEMNLLKISEKIKVFSNDLKNLNTKYKAFFLNTKYKAFFLILNKNIFFQY